MPDEAIWRRRFGLFMLARLFGIVIFGLGVAVVYTDVLREGGWPELGAVLIVAGVVDAVFAPKLLKKHWAKEDADSAAGGRG